MNAMILIPARYASTRFPGKPLHLIAGKPMLQWVYEAAASACQQLPGCQALLAIDDERVAAVADELTLPYVMTAPDCETGSDRVWEALQKLDKKPDFVVNLQGDSPLTPPAYLLQLLQAHQQNPEAPVITLASRLSWQALAKWRAQKQVTPFSGTSVVINTEQQALWFSKNILPAIRAEQHLRDTDALSPVYRHIGLYGFKYEALAKFQSLQPSYYEGLEGLEQLRLLEHGIAIRVETVCSKGGYVSIGVDTPEDARRVEEILAQEA